MLWLIPSSLLSSEFFFSGLIPCICICSHYLGLLGSCQVFVAKASKISEYISPNSFICLVSDMLNIVLFATLVVLFFFLFSFWFGSFLFHTFNPFNCKQRKKVHLPWFFSCTLVYLWLIFNWLSLNLLCSSSILLFYSELFLSTRTFLLPKLPFLFIRMRYLPFFFFSPLSLFVPNALTCVLV